MNGLAFFLTLPFMAWSFYADLSEGLFALGTLFLFLMSIFPFQRASLLKSAGILFIGLFYILGHKELLLFYPVLASAAVCSAFIVSMFTSPCLVLRMARKLEPDLPPEAESYCIQVNKVWIAVLVFNTVVSLWTATSGDLAFWSWYNGLFSYLFLGLVMAIEYLVRIRFRQSYENKASL